MRINPLENEHKKSDDAFLAALEKLRHPEFAPADDTQAYWVKAIEDAVEKARLLFKREWEITKRMGMPRSG